MGADKFTVISCIFTACAFVLSISSTAWCAFVNRDIQFDGTGVLSTESDLADFLLSSHGVGFWGWRLGDSCFDYTINGQTADFDTKYNTARASSVVATILGFVLTIMLLISLCTPVGNKLYMIMSLFLMMACLFQGLTLLIFKSSICEPGFFGFKGNFPQDPSALPNVDCSLSSGSNCAIAATVMYFVAALPCCFRAMQPQEEEGEYETEGAAADKEVEVPEEPQDEKADVSAEEPEQAKEDIES